MSEFLKLYRKVGGTEVLKQYYQAHVLLYSLILAVTLGFDKKSLEILRLAVRNKILKRLRKKYRRFIDIYVSKSQKKTGKKIIQKERKVWFCWLQGINEAPDIVKKCYSSIKEHINDREIILITNDNYKNYITFPDYIEDKIEKGIISKTHMSDLLRLELLVKYGGTWIDATVFCSDTPDSFYLDSDLFLFQTLKPGLDGKCTSISNWFITAEKGNNILDLTLKLLYQYWKTNDKLIDYFIFHDFFQLSIETYESEWKKVIPMSNEAPHILQLRMFEEYDKDIWESIKTQTPFHKLTYKCDFKDVNADSYYAVILGKDDLMNVM